MGSRWRCACGEEARFVGYRAKTVVTLVGTSRIRRAYYHCAACGTGQLPYDRQSGLGPGQLSNRLASAGSLLACQSSFEEASRTLEQLVGVRVDDNTLQQAAERAGAAALAAQDRQLAQAQSKRRPPAASVRPSRLYVSADGTTAPTLAGWREVKCGAVYWDDPIEGRQLRYTARLEGCEAFGPRLWHLACESGLRTAEEVVVLGDGAPWIWRQALQRFSRAVQILDWYHASEHVWACAHGLYGEGSEAAGRWADRMLGVLYEQGGATLLGRLRQSQQSRPQPHEALRELMGYVATHVSRMDYPAYRARDMDIGSGPVESACKRLVGGRLKGPGMRWTPAGAEAVLALRTAWFNGEWDTFWESKPLAA